MTGFDPLYALSPYVRYIGTTERTRTRQPFTISMETDNVFIFVIDGQCVHNLNGRKRVLSKGMLEIIPPYTAQTITVTEDQAVKLFYIYFDLFETEESHRLICRPGYKDTKRTIPELELYFIDKETLALVSDELYPRTLELFAELSSLQSQDDPLAGLSKKKIMLELLLIFLSSRKIPETDQEWIKRGYVARAIRHIEKNYDDYALCSETTARFLQVNAQYLSRLFKRELQMTLAQYIRHVRISRAKARFNLAESVTEVAAKCGFASVQSFSRTFRQATGRSPSDYRRTDN